MSTWGDPSSPQQGTGCWLPFLCGKALQQTLCQRMTSTAQATLSFSNPSLPAKAFQVEYDQDASRCHQAGSDDDGSGADSSPGAPGSVHDSHESFTLRGVTHSKAWAESRLAKGRRRLAHRDFDTVDKLQASAGKAEEASDWQQPAEESCSDSEAEYDEQEPDQDDDAMTISFRDRSDAGSSVNGAVSVQPAHSSNSGHSLQDMLASDVPLPSLGSMRGSVQAEPAVEETHVPHLRALPSALDEAWLQACWQIDPQDIFFATRPNGKLCRLGKGAFGTVYKGMYDGNPVAVKVCRQADLLGPGMRQFQKEAIILQSLRDEHVVGFVGACTWKNGKRTVLVTEYMERGDLFSLISKGLGRFQWERLGSRIALDVARGLAFLHARNIVHFDLKSANILLSKDYRAKLADVGLAKTLSDLHGGMLATVMATHELGTFAYSAPEVLLGMPCTSAADVYSFGVVLFEIATSEMPNGRNMRRIRVPQEGPQELAVLIDLCCQHDPARRPTSARLVKILEAMQQGQ